MLLIYRRGRGVPESGKASKSEEPGRKPQNCQGISQSSRGRDSSTCSERIISSGLLTFFSGSNDYNCNCLKIDNKDIELIS